MSYALITGASKGIGKAIAGEFARRGKSVLLVARNAEALRELSLNLETKYGVRTLYLSLDLSREEAPSELFQWCRENHYSVDVLVNNAGYGLSGAFDQHPLDDHLNMMQLNMNTVVRLTYLFLPELKKHQKSYLLNIASSAAYQATPFMTTYAASKSFVLLFSRGLHLELKDSNVSVTCVSPGATDTAFVDRALIGQKGRDMASKVHMHPEKVAEMAVHAMYQGKTELITGFLNKLGAFFVWLLPKSFVEKTAAKIYQ